MQLQQGAPQGLARARELLGDAEQGALAVYYQSGNSEALPLGFLERDALDWRLVANLR